MSQSGGRVPRHKGTGVSVAVATLGVSPVGFAIRHRFFRCENDNKYLSGIVN
ncbi:hypothetical protein [Dendronalium sp. ChiSLP03b]|uniref:hypothetical protein n=1 Tax=Dendronalium sp. ChiSLP03b TaxID=3075381 RepID=UPI002AD3A6BF|nr:hypothetical protein [Dendronalium sp. ChiSLP03b]MDZ8204147.1 hypothetical protein [Dendronalium sp. ChiSLP03b]